METIFLNAAGTVLFVRNDIEQGEWTQEEYTVNATFPYDSGKVIERGQRMAFRDPATNNLEVFEIRNVQNIEPEHYQQIIAEHIAVSELSDEHINNQEFYNVPPQTALAAVLTGTLWAVGNVSVGNPTEQAAIRAQITALGLNGNVDLTSRPIIYADKMKNAGYSDFDGDYATLYSMTYTKTLGESTDVTLLFTPIRQDGTVFSQDAIDSYVDNLIAISTTLAQVKANDTDGLLIHSLSGTQIAAMDAIAEDAHDLSDDWEQCNMGVSSSAKVTRGSVWQAVNTVAQNWNVYITPRIAYNAAGGIVGRYLDITHHAGTWRGLRLSVDSNTYDSCVTIDDTELYTALYGYGGNIDKVEQDEQDKTEELTFADIVWTATADHPAKPSGQTYLEDTTATALYGRNGRPRFGFYQNGDITDGEVLLQKTWEALKECNKPRVNVTGTVADFYRFGYSGVPVRLHDMAIVEIRPTGTIIYEQVTKNTVNLIDPSQTRPEIGAYIPNIIYINNDTNEKATGGGGGGGRGKTELEDDKTDTYTEWIYMKNAIGMAIGRKNGKDYIRGGQIVLSINEDHGTTALIQADTIDIKGIVDELVAYDLTIVSLETTGTATFGGDVYAPGLTITDGGQIDGASYISADDANSDSLTVDESEASWQSKQISIPTYGTSRYFLYAASSGSTTPTGTTYHYPITGHTEATIHYLGSINFNTKSASCMLCLALFIPICSTTSSLSLIPAVSNNLNTIPL